MFFGQGGDPKNHSDPFFNIDDNGNPVEITDAKGVITQIEYNSRGQVAKIINAFGLAEEAQTGFEYDQVTFNLIKVIDPLARRLSIPMMQQEMF